MKTLGESLDRYKEFTAWIAVFPPLTVTLTTYISTRFTFASRELGSILSIVFMFVALFLFLTSDKYVRRIVFSEGLSEDELVRLYKKAVLLVGLLIPIMGLVSALLVGYPDAPLTVLSFMIISLSGLGSAWKRFADKLTGNIVPPGLGGSGETKEKKGR